MFDGPVTLCAGVSLEPGKHLVISWARSSFRNFALRLVPGATSWLPSLFAAVVQPDTDGRVLVGRMAAWTSSPGRWQLPGGTVDPPAAGDVLDVAALRRHAALEAREEFGRVGRAEDLSFWSVLRGADGSVGVVFRAAPEPAPLLRHWFQQSRRADVAENRASEFDEVALVGSQDDVNALVPAVEYLGPVVRRFTEAPFTHAQSAEEAPGPLGFEGA